MLVTLFGDRWVVMLIVCGRWNLPSGLTTGFVSRW
jgi:hypothetical protein